VLGKDLLNPVPEWAEHRPSDGIVRLGIAPDMNTPDPDPGEEWMHVNTQLFGVLDEQNRGVFQPETSFNEPRAGQAPTMDGFVADYINRELQSSIARWPQRLPTARHRRPAVVSTSCSAPFASTTTTTPGSWKQNAALLYPSRTRPAWPNAPEAWPYS